MVEVDLLFRVMIQVLVDLAVAVAVIEPTLGRMVEMVIR
jgi:hypothetical protein